MAIATVNPASGETLRSFQPFSDAEIERALAKASNAFEPYRKTSFAERGRLLVKAGEILEARKEEFGALMTTEMGKTLRSAIEEAAKCAWVCRFYAEHAEKFLADEFVDTGAFRSYIHYEPLGTVLAIMPWNFPFWQAMRAAAPILSAGNVMLLKHASNVPQCALALESVFHQAGYPEGVFQALLVGASKVDAVLGDPRVAAATLTGSEQAGIEVGIGAARRIKKVVLELGGSDPFIVMPSADLDKVVPTAIKARVQNNGQSCIAAKRFIVADKIYDEFLRRFVQGMEALRIGDPFDASTELGPLSTPQGAEDLDGQVKKSVAAGARVLTGGKRLDGKGNFYAPTVLADIPKSAPAYSEELFGPVACVFRARDAEDAIRIANESRFGLGSSVWTNDPAERQLFIQGLESGMVFVNKMVASDPRMPFGGVKQSGHGRELGVFGIREFTNIKTVWVEDGGK
jgi:succinate-semialdehyde dehydrogenase / glutarate-semialdehyde dehydrogenase